MTSLSDRRETLTAIVQLSEHMLRVAKRGEWDDVPALESARRGSLEQFFAERPHPQEVDFIRSSLARILDLDRELLALSLAAKDEAGSKLKELHQGRRAQAAYDSNR